MKMRSSVWAVALIALMLSSIVLIPAVSAQQVQQVPNDRFEVRGTVINTANNQLVAGALVNMGGGNGQFSASDGTFVFTDVARGQYVFSVKRPGFFSEQDLNTGTAGGSWIPGTTHTVPTDRDIVLKLTPEGIIYGEVKNESGEPIDRLEVKAQRWQVENGRKKLQTGAQAYTDDEGRFRIAELRPGTYFVSFHQSNVHGIMFDELRPKSKTKDEGYGSQFYPGVSDVGSASAIPIQAGAQLHLAQTLGRQRLYEVSGVVRGPVSERGPFLDLIDESGKAVEKRVRITKTGEFQLQGVPAGMYLLRAVSMNQSVDGPDTEQQFSAVLPIRINSDVSGLVLMLQRGISLGVRIRNEMSADTSSTNEPQVSVELIGQEFQNFAEGISIPPPEGNAKGPRQFDGLLPGTYSVQATAYVRAYVADLRCGTVDLLQDDLTIAPGMSPPPIDVTLRDDGAELDITVTENGQPAPSGVLIYSEEHPKRSALIRGNGSESMNDLPPGVYQLMAVKNGEDIEFHDPAAIEKYLSRAKSVTLGPREKASVHLELQSEEAQ